MSYTIVIQSKIPHLLRKCLDSIKSEYNPQIILILDINAIEFNTKCDYETKEIYIDFKKYSSGAGMNIGFKLAKYDHMVWTQDDIVFEPYVLDKLYEQYELNDFVLLSPNIQEAERNLKIKVDIQTIGNENYLGRVFACFMISKHYYKIVGDIDEQFYPIYFEDMDYMQRLKEADLFRVGCVNYLVCKHEGKATVNQTPAMYIKENREKYIAKWGKLPRMES